MLLCAVHLTCSSFGSNFLVCRLSCHDDVIHDLTTVIPRSGSMMNDQCSMLNQSINQKPVRDMSLGGAGRAKVDLGRTRGTALSRVRCPRRSQRQQRSCHREREHDDLWCVNDSFGRWFFVERRRRLWSLRARRWGAPSTAAAKPPAAATTTAAAAATTATTTSVPDRRMSDLLHALPRGEPDRLLLEAALYRVLPTGKVALFLHLFVS